jgi:uncharacterized protein YjiS (DUF1127 family)
MSGYRKPQQASSLVSKDLMEAAMLKRLAMWWTTQRDIQTLEGLDDRMLADMGLSREAIRRRVRGDKPDGAGHSLPPCPSFSWAGNRCRSSHAQAGYKEPRRPILP